MSWSKEKISEFAQVTTGGTPSTDKREYWDGGNIPWLNSGDLNQGVITKASNFITEEGYKNSSTKLMPPNTVLIALTGATTGLSAILKIEACANQSVTGIFPSKKHYPEFLYYFLRTQRQKILDAAWGGAQPHINQKFVKDYEIPVPPLADQIKIATVLSKAEALIKQRKENIDLLDDFLKSAFLKMFSEVNTNYINWKMSTIKKECQVKGGKRIPKGFKLVKENTGHPYIKAGNIKGGRVTLDDLEYLPIELFNKLKRYTVNAGDVCITVVGVNIGDVGIVPEELDGANLTENANKFIIKNKSRLSNIFLSNYLSLNSTQKKLLNNIRAAGVPKLALFRIEELEIIIPPIELQNQFATIVEKAEALKEQFKNGLKDLEDLYASLSQRGFKGELDLGGLLIDHIIPISKGGSMSLENLQTTLMRENIEKADKFPQDIRKGKQANRALEIDEETAKKNGEEFYNEWKKYHAPKIKSKLNWDKVSTEQAANWIKERYNGYHFNSEMLIRFMMEEYVTIPDYFSSEELKKYPRTNEADDFKSFLSAAVVKENPFVHFEQLFYNGETENFQLQLTEEDYLLIKDKTPRERSGIYFKIADEVN